MAVFGKIDCQSADENLDVDKIEQAVSKACDCAQALTIAVRDAVNPALSQAEIEGGLQIGVGVDSGIFIATKIGIERSYEFTAYGDCVNRASKLADHGKSGNRVVVSHDVKQLFPVSPKGKTGFDKVPNQTEAYFLKYPANHKSFT